ncbi:MAG: hypothetical protein VB015_01575 [Erysipelotrichaceae bacterium]|nr:hypothetical protein [Erysipelotrichaceae bacterium]
MDDSSNFSGFDGDNIFEPLMAFKNVYKDSFEKNATEYFNQLVEKSQIDIDANRATSKKIKDADAGRNDVIKKLKNKVGLNGFLIFLIVLGFLSAGAGVFFIIDGTIVQPLVSILMIVIGLVVAILLIVLSQVKLKPIIKELRGSKEKFDKQIEELKKEAWTQMAPLNALFTRGIGIELFKKTIPIINIDKMFDSKRLDYLVNRFGLSEVHDLNRSCLYVQSGDIVGNPFFIANDLTHNLGTKTYIGELVIHWTTTSYVNGRTVTNYHTQTLQASVTKPCPYYGEIRYLVYGNEAAPDLIFSRQDSDAEKMNEKQIDKMVDKETKKLEKMSEESVKKGGNYTVMGNSEFEVIFGAKNRNNEVQFRLLFTPLAQKQLLQIMKDKEIGYGDDFDFVKNKMINIIYPEHLATMDLDVPPVYFMGYDYEVVKHNFIVNNNMYFKGMFFTFAPILAIPLYQQQKPHEFIYKDLYDSYVSFYEHEHVVNAMNETEFKHPLSKTRNILKTSVVKSGDFCDTVKVTAYGYDMINRTDYVSVMGGDGRSHTIAVNWVEYIPVSQDTEVNVNVVGEEKEETYADKFKKAIENLHKGQLADEKDIYRIGLFLAYVIKNKQA